MMDFFPVALPAITAMFQTGRQSPCRLRQSTGGKFIPNLLKLPQELTTL